MEEIFPPEIAQKQRHSVEKVFETNQKIHVELEIPFPDGEAWLSTNLTPIRNDTGEVMAVLGISRDITERKQLGGQLLQAQKMEALGQLAGGIAHDFHNVMAAILGFAELGLRETSARSRVRRRLLKIKYQSQHATELIRRLLAFASRQILVPRTVNVNQTVTSVLTMLESVIGEQIEVTTVLAPDLEEIQADPGQLQQVLMNLCLNARDAMAAGGRMLIETRNVDSDGDDDRYHENVQPGSYVLLSVSDTGVGMGETTMKQMFEPFFTTKETGKASGLGLAMVYGIIKQHDGFIHADSEPDRGTTFYVYLPVRGEATGKPQEKAGRESTRGGTETILLAEDHEDVREVTQEMLEGLGYRVVVAGNGKEAVQVFREKCDRIALVLLDVVLPKLSGPAAYAKMVVMKPGLRVVFITGYSTDISVLRAMVEKRVTVLQKPHSTDMLARAVRETLDQPKPE